MAMSKCKRARVVRGVQYGILVAVVLLVVFSATWSKIRTMLFDLERAGLAGRDAERALRPAPIPSTARSVAAPLAEHLVAGR